MDNFEKLKAALMAAKTDSYKETVEKAKDILVKLGNYLLDKDGEKLNNARIVEHKTKDGKRMALVVEEDEKPILALMYAKDDSNRRGIDLQPTDPNSEPITLEDKDASEISTVFEYLAEDARKKQETEDSSDESSDDPLDKLLEGTKDSFLRDLITKIKGTLLPSEEEDKYMQIITKITNTVKGLDGPKYDSKVTMYSHGSCYIFTVEGKEVLIISCRHGVCSIGDSVKAGPFALKHVSFHFNELLKEFLKFADKQIENNFNESEMFDTLEHLFDALPQGVRTDILNDLVKKVFK